MEQTDKKTFGQFIDGVLAIFRRKNKTNSLTDRHEMVLKDLADILTFEDTSINVDTIAKKYYVENVPLHVAYCIIGNSDVIMMGNTHDNVDKKFDSQVISQIIDLILTEKNKRCEKVFFEMEKRTDSMINRIGSIIRKEKEARLLAK